MSWQTPELVPPPRRNKSGDNYTKKEIGMGYIETTNPNLLCVVTNRPLVGTVTAACDFAPTPTVVGGTRTRKAFLSGGTSGQYLGSHFWCLSWRLGGREGGVLPTRLVSR